MHLNRGFGCENCFQPEFLAHLVLLLEVSAGEQRDLHLRARLYEQISENLMVPPTFVHEEVAPAHASFAHIQMVDLCEDPLPLKVVEYSEGEFYQGCLESRGT